LHDDFPLLRLIVILSETAPEQPRRGVYGADVLTELRGKAIFVSLVSFQTRRSAGLELRRRAARPATATTRMPVETPNVCF
jgi:hypothetical protein